MEKSKTTVPIMVHESTETLIKENITTSLTPSNPTQRYPRSWLLTLLQKHHPQAKHALIVAPMVDQSDLPFRLLCRKYSANLAYTPMIHSRLFIEKGGYRKKFWQKFITPKEDRPLVAQFCGSDPDVVLEAAQYLEDEVDVVDINCGCPQNIAKRGKYGAFLLEKEDVLVKLVTVLAANLKVPLSVKVRILPDGVEATVDLCRKLVKAGASMICLHGRNRFQKGPLTGKVNWDAIRRIREDEFIGGLVPVIANGGISCMRDVNDCLNATGADGVMSSEAILEYPALFYEKGIRIPRIRLAREYFALAKQYPPEEGGQGNGIKCIRVHLHRILHADLQTDTELRDIMSYAMEMSVLEEAMDKIELTQKLNCHIVEEEKPSWYTRHTRMVKCADGVTRSSLECRREGEMYVKRVHLIESEENQDGEAMCFGNLFDEAVY